MVMTEEKEVGKKRGDVGLRAPSSRYGQEPVQRADVLGSCAS